MAIALGVAWSPAAAALPDLAHLVDFVEIPAWALGDMERRPPRRMVVHNVDKDSSLADPGYIDDAWAERARGAVRAVNSPWLSLHLGFSTEAVRFEEHMLPESPVLERTELFDRIVASVRRAREYAGVPLLLENLDYCPEGAYEHVCDPEFISDVIESTGAELLLDIAHLRVSASWRCADPFVMLETLPLNRLRELHLSGPRPLPGSGNRLDDAHDTLEEVDYALLEQVLARRRPSAVVLEYRRDPLFLRAQLQTLGRRIGRARRGAGC